MSAQASPASEDGGHDARERDETPTERLDRNWADLLQELRVIQTGVQFLTGFLLTLPFQQKFSQLDDGQTGLYLATVSASIGATGFLQAPVSVHRALFRRHQRSETVKLAHRMAIVGMALLSIAMTGVAALIFDVVVGRRAAILATVIVFLLLSVLWAVVPLASRGPATNIEEPPGQS